MSCSSFPHKGAASKFKENSEEKKKTGTVRDSELEEQATKWQRE